MPEEDSSNSPDGKTGSGGGPYYFAVPIDGQMSLCVALKVENNGQTFVASRVYMSWIDKAAQDCKVIDVEDGSLL